MDSKTDTANEPASIAKPVKVLPRLMLAPLEPIELLLERLHEPSDESPILYRERAYLVDALQSDDDLEEHLEAELSRIRRDWRHRDASQFVQLALYDHRFDGEPNFPPVATLSWKDWQGRSEIWVRGVRRSTLPPGIPLDSIPPVPRPGRPTAAERRAIERARPSTPPDDLDLPVFEPSEEELQALDDRALDGVEDSLAAQDDETDFDDITPVSALEGTPASAEQVASAETRNDEERNDEERNDEERNDEERNDEEHNDEEHNDEEHNDEEHNDEERDEHAHQRAASDEASDPDPSDAAPDSGPAWQSPDRSGEFPIPVQDELPAAPSSQRVLASEELIGVLFERLNELAYVATLGAGADCLLAGLSETIPCDGALIHVIDVEAEEFVVMRALGPDQREVIGRRTPGPDSHLFECLRRKATLELGQSDISKSRLTWQALGVLPRHVIASPVHRLNQSIGVIELCRTTAKGPFSSGQVSALEYACEQFAEFAAERPMELARASLYPPAPP